MKHDRVTGEIQETAALYVLGALSQFEAGAFEAHLRDGCPVCEAEFRRFDGTAGQIGAGVPEVETSAYLRELLFARIEREPQQESAESPVVKETQSSAAEVKPSETPATPPATAPLSNIFAPPAQERSRLPWVVAACLAIAAGLGFFAWKQADDNAKQTGEKLAAAQADATNLRALIDVQRDRSRELEQINSALANPATRIIHLQSQKAESGVSAAIFWDTQKGRLLMIGSFPPDPEGRVHQLWLLLPGISVNAGLVRADSLGHVFMTIDIPVDLSKLSGASISLEPPGGSKQPTPPVIATGKVS